ncbi:DNA primase [Eggerthellaceae bacterium 3-80]|nr:DNA primase [bacterium D16-34]
MAGSISAEDIQKVREATDLVAFIAERTPVKQKGRDFWCCCPLHNEKTPSFKIDSALQLWHCFGCGEGGDAFDFVMKTEGLSFPEAVRRLANRAHIEIEETAQGKPRIGLDVKNRLKAICEATEQFYHTQLMRGSAPLAQQARDYLSSRDLGGSVPKDWQLGFAPGNGILVKHLRSLGFNDAEMEQANVAVRAKSGNQMRDRFYNRIMFPIHDISGECIAFGGRAIGQGEPKYLNSQETPIFHKSEVLYGLDKAKAAMASCGIAVVTEGYTDVIALHEAGVKNAVATLGTALTMRHIRVLSRHAQKRIVYLFDGDEAGQRAADRALGFIDESMTPEAGRTRVELVAVTLPDNLDPADFVKQRGVEELLTLLDSAVPLVQYGIDRRIAQHDLSHPEGRTLAAKQALEVLAPIKDSLLAKDYARQIAGRVRMEEADALAVLASLKPPRRAYEEPDTVEIKPAQAVRSKRFSPQEKNRRSLEAQLLSLFAKRCDLVLPNVSALAQTQWHDPVHAQIAEVFLDQFSQNPTIEPAALVGATTAVVPVAGAILTKSLGEGSYADEISDEDRIMFLIDELAIGDAEEAIADLRAQLNNPSQLSSDEYDMLYMTVAAMQKDLIARRAARKML